MKKKAVMIEAVVTMFCMDGERRIVHVMVPDFAESDYAEACAQRALNFAGITVESMLESWETFDDMPDPYYAEKAFKRAKAFEENR